MNSHTLATTLAAARTIATTRRRPRRKVEKAYDKLVSGVDRLIERQVFRSRGGQPAHVADVAAIDQALRVLVDVREDIAKLDQADAKTRAAGRRDLRERLAVASATLLDSFGASSADSTPQPVGRDLRRSNVLAMGAQLEPGDAVYTGGSGVTPALVEQLRGLLRARGLVLQVTGVSWYRTKPVTTTGALEQRGRCAACGGETWLRRCRRCGTCEAASE